MKNILNKNNNKLLLILLVLVIGAILLIVLINTGKKQKDPFDNNKNDNKEIANVTPDDVKKLYNILTSNTCNIKYTFDFSNNKTIKTEDMSETDKLTIIFNNLKYNNIIKDKISIEEYNTYAKNILGNSTKIPSTFKDFNYDGNTYNIEKNKIIKNTSTCNTKEEYKSALYSYSYNLYDLSIYINYIEIKNNKAYDLDGKLIDTYTKENEERIMNSATSYVYNFKKNTNGYYLQQVSLAVKETNK